MLVKTTILWNEPAVNGYHAIDNFNYALFTVTEMEYQPVQWTE